MNNKMIAKPEVDWDAEYKAIMNASGQSENAEYQNEVYDTCEVFAPWDRVQSGTIITNTTEAIK